MTPKEIFDILTKEIGLMPEIEEDAQLWFKDAYNNGSTEVKKALLELLTYNVIKPADENEEIMWIFRTVFHGKLENKKKLRQMYYEGHGDDKTRVEIVEYINQNAKKHDLESIIFMGHIHSGGFGVEKDIDIAHNWYNKAAQKGDAGAQIAVADYHFRKEEYDKAHNWYHKAAKQNKKTAYIRLSMMYKLGLGVEKNREKSLYYKNKAKEGVIKVKQETIRKYMPKSKKKYTKKKKHEKR